MKWGDDKSGAPKIASAQAMLTLHTRYTPLVEQLCNFVPGSKLMTGLFLMLELGPDERIEPFCSPLLVDEHGPTGNTWLRPP